MLWVVVKSLLTLGQPHLHPTSSPEKAHKSRAPRVGHSQLALRWKESTSFFELNFCFVLERSWLTMLELVWGMR